MTLRLYDTRTRALRDFDPVVPGHAGIYHCGLTVQGPPHIGHIRKEVTFDLLRRWLEHSGYTVTLVANITDIEDKVLAKSAEQGRPWWALAYENEGALHRAYTALGCLPPTYEPRATGHVPEMLELIGRLVTTGHAYVAADGSGDVYFDVRSWPAYGELSHQRLDDMEAAADADPRGKRDPRDFALWKGFKKESEPPTAAWPSPWGLGRPGWHIECSAMAGKYLGDEFDIHGGGLDLRFPHHENELAQSRAAGRGFARTWMHNGMVNLAGEKMSKSVGNDLLVSEVVRRVRPVELRYFLAAPHYRSTIEYSEGALADAVAAYRRIEGFCERAAEVAGPPVGPGPVPADFAAALDDDLGVPQALAVVHKAVREGNTALAAGDKEVAAVRLAAVRSMLGVLGLDPLDPGWSGAGVAGGAGSAGDGGFIGGPAGGERLRPVVDGLVRALLDQREQARQRRDWAAADAIRDQLRATGVEVTDTPQGPRWTVPDQPGA